MARTQNQTGRMVKKATVVNQHISLVPASMEKRWLDRAGDEIEQIDRFSAEEYQLAKISALEHGEFEEDCY